MVVLLVAAFTDNAGKVSTSSGNESGYTFTVVGTDLSGTAQTEVITGPTANSTVLGLKHLKHLRIPSSNSTEIFRWHIRCRDYNYWCYWSATLDNVTMSADVSNKTFTIATCNAAGLKVKYSGLGADATVYYGQSLIEKLTSFDRYFRYLKW